MFNYMSDDQKFFMAFAGLAGGSWGLSLHWTFNYLNARNDFYFFRVWMRITQELPAKSEQDYEVNGLPREENKRFWQTEKRLNSLWLKVSSGFIGVSCIVFCGQLFLVPFEADLSVYVLVQTLHVLHSSYSLVVYLHSFFSINLFYIWTMKFTSTRFAHIARQVQRLCAPEATGPPSE